MPRVSICRKKYMLQDLPAHFTGRLKQKDLASVIGIDASSFCVRNKKAREKAADVFSYGDLLEMIKAADLSDEEILQIMKL